MESKDYFNAVSVATNNAEKKKKQFMTPRLRLPTICMSSVTERFSNHQKCGERSPLLSTNRGFKMKGTIFKEKFSVVWKLER